ncbi:MAG TPA: ATP-binding cassette domain-containing protein [Stenomitos sp.]
MKLNDKGDPVGATLLRLEGVSVLDSLGRSRLLDNVSFSIEDVGSKIGIVGASGAGKTTLLRVLNRLIDPNAGQVFWHHKPLQTYPVPQLRQRIMLVPQEPRLLGMTVAETLAYPLQLQQCTKGLIQQRVQDWCQRLEIPEAWQARQEFELSVGQRQWVSLARAFIAQPEVLLLDEPTSALDTGRVDLLMTLLAHLDATVLMVSHQLTTIQKVCDRILWVEQGRLAQDCLSSAMDWDNLKMVLTKAAASSESEAEDF